MQTDGPGRGYISDRKGLMVTVGYGMLLHSGLWEFAGQLMRSGKVDDGRRSCERMRGASLMANFLEVEARMVSSKGSVRHTGVCSEHGLPPSLPACCPVSDLPSAHLAGLSRYHIRRFLLSAYPVPLCTRPPARPGPSGAENTRLGQLVIWADVATGAQGLTSNQHPFMKKKGPFFLG